MSASKYKLPFDLVESDLPKVEITYSFHLARTGAGKQELTIRGSGQVSLYATPKMDSTPIIHEAIVEPKIVVRLLDIMADQGFLNFEEHYGAKGDRRSHRMLSLVLPGRTKTVTTDESGFSGFDMVAGATKFAAALALPEALYHRFFPNL